MEMAAFAALNSLLGGLEGVEVFVDEDGAGVAVAVDVDVVDVVGVVGTIGLLAGLAAVVVDFAFVASTAGGGGTVVSRREASEPWGATS